MSVLLRLLPLLFLTLVTGSIVSELLTRLKRQVEIAPSERRTIVLVMLRGSAAIAFGVASLSEYVLNDSDIISLAVGVGLVAVGLAMLVVPLYAQLREEQKCAAEGRIALLLAAVPVYVGLGTVTERSLSRSASVVAQAAVLVLVTAWFVSRLVSLKTSR